MSSKCKVHQHFKSSFCANILVPKKYKPKTYVQKICMQIFHTKKKKNRRKMLVKLTQGILIFTQENGSWRNPSFFEALRLDAVNGCIAEKGRIRTDLQANCQSLNKRSFGALSFININKLNQATCYYITNSCHLTSFICTSKFCNLGGPGSGVSTNFSRGCLTQKALILRLCFTEECDLTSAEDSNVMFQI